VLGNGLCLDLASNNAFSIQGCTDPSWPNPCANQFRQFLNAKKGGYVYVFACRRSFRTPYCLGVDASCCSDKSNFIFLPRIKNPHLQDVQKTSNTGSELEVPLEEKQADSTGVEGDNEQLVLGRLTVAAAIVLPLLGIIVALCAWLCAGTRIRSVKKSQDDDQAASGKYRDGPSQDVERSSNEAVLEPRLSLPLSPYDEGTGSVDFQRARSIMEENPWGTRRMPVKRWNSVCR
jgi:hypothetical protein